VPTVLVTSTVFNDNGTALDIFDPTIPVFPSPGRRSRTLYDAARRPPANRDHRQLLRPP